MPDRRQHHFLVGVFAAVAACVALSLAGCATTHSTVPQGAIQGFALLNPSTLQTDRRAQQVLRAAFANQEITLTTVIDVQGDKLNVVGITATGQRVFSLHMVGKELSIDSRDSAVGANLLPPQQLLNDLQLAYWPLSALQGAMAGSPWRVKQLDAHTRRLYREDKLIAEVHYADNDPWSGRFWLVNFQFGYSLAIESRLLPTT